MGFLPYYADKIYRFEWIFEKTDQNTEKDEKADKDTVIKYAQSAKAVVSVEEHSPFGGLGSMVAQVVGENCPRKCVTLALPDSPVITGTSQEVFDYYGLNAEGIAARCEELL